MNEADLLPLQYLRARVESERSYLINTFPITQFIRVCTDHERTCPLKRLGGCRASHCIKRHPTPEMILRCRE